MKTIFVCFVIINLSFHYISNVSAKSSTELRAAFVRNNDMWIKINNKELRIIHSENVSYPKWSFSGDWIAYIKEKKEDQIRVHDKELWIYNVKLDKHFKICSCNMEKYQWAPNKNVLGFLDDEYLNIIDVQLLQSSKRIASEIINFSWLPDGSGLLTSSKKGKSVFSDIVLSKFLISPKNNQEQVQSHHFYTIPVKKKDYFYGTSQFKWSYNQNWIAFQLVPTASISADNNTLSVISKDGKSFRKIGGMLNYEDWFQWAPNTNFLAYINGFDRIAIKNKVLKVNKIDKRAEHLYTPKGYVDRDLIWGDDSSIYVSRSLESEWTNIGKRPMPSIYKIDIRTSASEKVTFPQANEGDFLPHYIQNQDKLVWIRTNRSNSNVMISDSKGLEHKIWIDNINTGSWFYEHWDWDRVFNLYEP
ncbi:hypothetical protein [Bacillus sp. SM2101]|uniref:hypothetical protein n=1 Tax=Bacillus sp. SM2101 TaxID=2805366 RepID=UPI001BDF02D2|nr:hypothetical protein [Bacillus sp. SM2101]